MTGTTILYGGTGGIGSATARKIAERGGRVHLVARDASRLTALATEIQATWTAGDVSDPSLFERATREAAEPLTGLVYAVGTINLKSLGRLTEQDFLLDLRVNAIGAALAVQAAAPALKRSPKTSSVVLFSSVAARQGFSFHASTGMAKAAVEGLTVALAAELAPKVRVNAIAPSLTRTGLATGLLSNEQTASAIASLHAIPRLGEPGDIASLAAFLLSDEADWITGQIVGVDGGRASVRTKG